MDNNEEEPKNNNYEEGPKNNEYEIEVSLFINLKNCQQAIFLLNLNCNIPKTALRISRNP